MPKEALIKNLQQLQLELEKVHFEHETSRESVSQQVLELESKLLDESFMSSDEYLLNEIKEALGHFEEEHPEVTALVGNISDLLAKMGI